MDDYFGHNYLMYVQYDYPDVPAHVTVRNTIFSSRGPEAPIFVAQASTLVADHNLFYLSQNETVLNLQLRRRAHLLAVPGHHV